MQKLATHHKKPAKLHSGPDYIDYRYFKNFNEHMFVDDLFKVPWQDIEKHDNVDDALELWNSMFFDVINNHLPMKISVLSPLQHLG